MNIYSEINWTFTSATDSLWALSKWPSPLSVSLTF